MLYNKNYLFSKRNFLLSLVMVNLFFVQIYDIKP